MPSFFKRKHFQPTHFVNEDPQQGLRPKAFPTENLFNKSKENEFIYLPHRKKRSVKKPLSPVTLNVNSQDGQHQDEELEEPPSKRRLIFEVTTDGNVSQTIDPELESSQNPHNNPRTSTDLNEAGNVSKTFDRDFQEQPSKRPMTVDDTPKNTITRSATKKKNKIRHDHTYAKPLEIGRAHV